MAETSDNANNVKEHIRIFPMMMTYVVFQIDPVESVVALSDPEATASAKTIETKKYAGYVSGFETMIQKQPFQGAIIQVLRQGPPPRVEDEFIEHDMCVAVAPNTAQPSSRPPLQPQSPLPWADCYHASHDTFLIRVRTEFADARPALSLPIRQGGLHTKYRNQDGRRRDELRDAHEAQHPPQQLDRMITGANQRPGSSIAPSSENGSRMGSSTYEDAEEYFDTDDIEEALTSEALPLASVTYDLSSVQEPLPDPKDLLEEIRLIEQLHKESAVRAPERLARAIADARARDEAAFAHAQKPEPNTQPSSLPTHHQISKDDLPSRVAVPLSSPDDQITQSGVAHKSKVNAFAASRGFFNEHPFWGVPAQTPAAISIRRVGVKLRKAIRVCACGLLGPADSAPESSSKHKQEHIPLAPQEQIGQGAPAQVSVDNNAHSLGKPPPEAAATQVLLTTPNETKEHADQQLMDTSSNLASPHIVKAHEESSSITTKKPFILANLFVRLPGTRISA